jgi:hypothetical protein
MIKMIFYNKLRYICTIITGYKSIYTASMERYISEADRKQGKHLIKKFNEIIYEQDRLSWIN